MGWILLCIFVGVPALIFGMAAIGIAREEAKCKKAKEEAIKKKYQDLYNELLQSKYNDHEAEISGLVKELPQLTFSRWLTFYNTNPENWDIDICATNIGDDRRNNHYVPTYYKRTVHKDKKDRVREIINVTAIPIFWSSAEEMRKFDEWVHNDYKAGKAAGFENKRDEFLEQLAECLQEDINERKKKIQEDYARVVDSVKVENSNIELQLQENGKKVMTSSGYNNSDIYK